MLRAASGRSFLPLLASAGVIACAAPAWGEAPAEPAATADTADLPEITIVARKRAENAQQVPIPVTVISSAELSRQNLVNFTGFQTKFPSFSVFLTNPKQLNLGIRGIGNNGFNTDGVDGSVGIFVDGVYTGRQGMVSSDFNDIADVELLRGPQGTLFGKNTTAGAVIVNTLKPSFTFGASGEATYGNYDFKEVKASVTGPLIADKLAVRLSGFYSKRDGNYRNLFNNQSQNGRQGSGIRAQLLATPTDDLSIRLIGTHGRQSFPTISPVILSVYNPAALVARMAAAGYTLFTSTVEDRNVNIDSPLNARTKLDSGSGEIDYHVGSLGELTSITAYENWSCFTNNDNDFTQLDAINDYGSCNKEHQFSQEVRWATPKDKALEATVGGFLSRQRLQVDSRFRFGRQYNIFAANPSATAFPNVAGVSWANGAYASRLAGTTFQSVAVFHTDTDALFGNVSWHPDAARRLSIDVGLRYTWEDRTQIYNGFVAANPGTLTQAQLNALSPSTANAQLGQVDTGLKNRALSGEAGVNYKVTPDIFVYGKYARGNKSAGFNLLAYNSTNPDTNVGSALSLGAQQTVKGETADNFEAGFKSAFLDRRVTFNVTLFHTKVKNYQANQSLGAGAAIRFLANVGSLTSRGIEAELETRLAPGLHTKGFVAYDKATYSSFHNSACPAQSTALTCDITGRQVAWAPKYTMDFTVDYTTRVTESVKAYGLFDVNYRTRQNYTITLDPAAEGAGYALASARVGVLLLDDTLDLQLWSENLFNKAYFINLLGLTRATGIIQGYPGNPRTFGVTAKFRF